jgi:hypothetical protein
MSVLKSEGKKNENEREEMLNKNLRIERMWSGLGWGIFFILIGSLIFASNRGWLRGGEGWVFFIIGLGGIFIIGFLVRLFANRSNRWTAFGGLVVGVCLVYVGVAFLYGFADWWPLVFILVGIAYLTSVIWNHKSGSYTE